MLKLKYLFIPAFLFCSYASYATTPDSHDTVSFKNGDTLTGSVLLATSATVNFSNKGVGALTLKWTDLKGIDIHHPIRVVDAQGKPQDLDGAAFTVAPTSSAAKLDLQISGKDTAIADVKSITGLDRCSSGIQSACPGWQLQQLAVNTAFVTSTQHQQTYGAKLTLFRNWYPEDDGWPHERTRIELLPNYDEKRKNEKPGSAVITQDYFGRFQQMIFLNSDSLYVPITADLFRNNSLGVYFEQSYGAGLGTLRKNGLELDADIRFIGEHFYGVTPSLSLVGSELQEQYEFNLPAGFVFFETLDYVPVFNASHAWQGKAVAGLLKPIVFTPKLSFSAMVTDDYIENAPPTFRKNYVKTTVGLTFSPGTKH
jgi:hypothetical protein